MSTTNSNLALIEEKIKSLELDAMTTKTVPCTRSDISNAMKRAEKRTRKIGVNFIGGKVHLNYGKLSKNGQANNNA